MASLSNINGLFDVHSTGAILFNTSHGTSGQILKSNGNAAPTWVAASTVIGGPYLPVSGGTLTGALAGTSATFSGQVNINSGSDLRLYRSDNATYARFNYAGGSVGLDIDDLNSDGINLQQAGVNKLRIETSGNATFAGIVGMGSTGIYAGTAAQLNLPGRGLAIKNDKNGSNNNWSYIENTATGSASNINFYTGNNAAALTLAHNGNATFSGNVRISKTDATLEINNSTGSLTNADLYISVEDTGQADVRQYGAYPLAFWTNNAERMRIDSSGKIQVGSDKVIWAGGYGGGLVIRQNNATGDRLIKMVTVDSTGAIVSDNVLVAKGASVGIGTGSPAHKLNVVAPNNTTAVGIDFPSASFDFSANSTSGYTTSFHMDNTGTYIGSNSAGRALIFQTNDTDRLYINGNTGNVGIGTVSPDSVLHIKDNTAGPTQLSIQSNDFTRAEEINFLNPSTSAISGQIQYYTNPTVEYMSFSVANNSAAVERMRIKNTGAIEIKGSSTTANAQAFITNDNSLLTIGSSVSGSVVKDIQFSSPSAMMYIDGSKGSVGIGTTLPDQTGYGYKTLTIMGGTPAGYAGVLELLTPSTNANGQNLGIVSFGVGGTRNAMIGAIRESANNNGTLQFWTSADSNGIAKRMSILANGNVIIGTETSTACTFKVSSTKNGSESSPHFCITGNGYSALHWLDTNAYNIVSNSVGRDIEIRANINGVILTPGATAWASNSDIALKENINPLEDVLDKIKDYRCVEYNLKNSPEDKKIGFIAQDWVNDFSPIINKDKNDMLSMKYSETIPVLLKAIQELTARIKELENK